MQREIIVNNDEYIIASFENTTKNILIDIRKKFDFEKYIMMNRNITEYEKELNCEYYDYFVKHLRNVEKKIGGIFGICVSDSNMNVCESEVRFNTAKKLNLAPICGSNNKANIGKFTVSPNKRNVLDNYIRL